MNPGATTRPRASSVRLAWPRSCPAGVIRDRVAADGDVAEEPGVAGAVDDPAVPRITRSYRLHGRAATPPRAAEDDLGDARLQGHRQAGRRPPPRCRGRSRGSSGPGCRPRHSLRRRSRRRRNDSASRGAEPAAPGQSVRPLTVGLDRDRPVGGMLEGAGVSGRGMRRAASRSCDGLGAAPVRGALASAFRSSSLLRRDPVDRVEAEQSVEDVAGHADGDGAVARRFVRTTTPIFSPGGTTSGG